MQNIKQIVLMNDNTAIFNQLGKSLAKKHNVLNLKVTANEMGRIPSNFEPDLFIINFADASKADILFICDTLNSRPYDRTPIVYAGSYISHSLFSSKIKTLLRAVSYLTSNDLNDVLNQVIRILGNIQKPQSSESNDDLLSESFPEDSTNQAAAAKTVRKRVLIIDDDPLLLTTVARYLADDFAVSAVDSTARGFMDIGENKPDIILLDYMMPLCDGKQTLSMLRNQYETRNIPVVMLTAHTEKERVLECHNLGISAYLVKPVNRNDLLDTLKRILNI